jgi:hypothetical protein
MKLDYLHSVNALLKIIYCFKCTDKFILLTCNVANSNFENFPQMCTMIIEIQCKPYYVLSIPLFHIHHKVHYNWQQIRRISFEKKFIDIICSLINTDFNRWIEFLTCGLLNIYFTIAEHQRTLVFCLCAQTCSTNKKYIDLSALDKFAWIH